MMGRIPEASLTRRAGFSVCGIVIMMAGTALLTLSQLGTAPVSSPVWAVTLIGGLSFGGWTFVLNLFLIVAQYVMLRPAFPKSGWLQLPALLCAAPMLDVWMWLLSGLRPDSYLASCGLVVLGIVILAWGVSLLAASQLLFLPGEGFVSAVSQKLQLPFAKVKLRFDLGCVFVALVLSVGVLHSFDVVREATIASAVLLGPLVGALLPSSRALVGTSTCAG
ncbi:hypothetical protein G7Y31_11635 [Corynebacterium lizhenjunii]|uniref:Uncharacterized protein n=1 Tax=Corynebacterium lizhenjunii TaxID=2709394 RepID=A0A7T0PBX6_9CORY|nr:DUF6198 family protein [Corynebacterium lizhenjunii]QPK79122.1 hypothetical protein G7Y31_11635 [Corynebacterium lizhenjunii]